MKKIICLLVFLFLAVNLAQAQWQTILTVQQPNTLFGSVFMDDTTGIVASSSYIHRTTDAGNTWITDSTTPGININLISFAPQSDTGYYVVSYDSMSAGLYRSVDKGETWEAIFHFMIIRQEVQSFEIYGMKFINGANGCISSSIGIFRTANAGENWDRVLGVPVNKSAFSLDFINESIGYALVGLTWTDRSLYKTFDGGANWFLLSSTTQFDSISSIKFIAEGVGYILKFNKILRTTNDGLSWQTQFQGNANYLCDVSFRNLSTGYVVGYLNCQLGCANFIIETSDGGNTWNEYVFNYGIYLNQITCTMNNCYVVDMSAGGGTISRLTSITSIINHQEKNVDFKLHQNYPNPFNPVTKIQYSLPRSSTVTMKIFDVSGKEVAMLVNEKQSTGNYEVSFDGSNLSSGVYFYKLTAGNFTDTKKMLLIK